jgi:hypothetical protein
MAPGERRPRSRPKPGLLHPVLVGGVLVLAVVVGLVPPAAEGAPLPPVGAAGSGGADAGALEARLLAARLVALGLSGGDAAARVAALTPAERRELAERVDEVDAGGSAAAVLSIAIIIGLIAILILELLGRRVISRPAPPPAPAPTP